MNPQVFRLPDHASACDAARGLQAEGLTSRAGVRHGQAYLTVWSDRPDVPALVRALVADATTVPLAQVRSLHPRGARHGLLAVAPLEGLAA